MRWPARLRTPGSTSDALVGHVDMVATMARLTGQALPDAAGLDSSDVLGALLDNRTAGRAEMVLHSPWGVALRQGPWKLIAGPGGAQLFDLATDIGETHDLAKDLPVLAKEMQARLAKIKVDGRSRSIDGKPPSPRPTTSIEKGDTGTSTERPTAPTIAKHTKFPTAAPSAKPTTAAPTKMPSSSPTSRPSKPTPSPTLMPSVAPTAPSRRPIGRRRTSLRRLSQPSA